MHTLMGNSMENGIYAASLTPLNQDLSCNSEELASHCLDLIERGCKGVVLMGTTGEGPSFSTKERIEILKAVVDKGVDPQKILVANGAANIPETIDLTRAALNLNISTMLICPPSFFKNVSEEGVIAFYREIIRRVDHPNLRIILYHIPQYSGVPITLKIAETLHSQFPNTVIGIKESEGNLPLAKAMIDQLPHFKVFVGSERQIIEATFYGAAGSICGLANLYPELICSLLSQGKQSLRENPRELTAFFEARNGYPFISVCKAVMEKRRGSVWHALRPPLVPLTTEEKEAFFSAKHSRSE